MQSIRGRMLRGVLGLMNAADSLVDTPLAKTREQMKLLGKIPPGTRVEPVSANGVACEWVIPDNAEGDRCLYFIHGGGFVMGSCDSHRPLVARLAQEFRARALHVEYRLAPEHPFPAAPDDCLTAYRWLLEQGDVNPAALVIGGESAGGSLVLTTVMDAIEQGLPTPAAAFFISPFTDFSFDGESIDACAKTAVFLNQRSLEWVREQYAPGVDPKSPRLSPLQGDFAGFPPMSVHVANAELLRDDSTRLAGRAREAGASVTLQVWDGLFHGFPGVPFLPESRAVVRQLSEFVDLHLAPTEE